VSFRPIALLAVLYGVCAAQEVVYVKGAVPCVGTLKLTDSAGFAPEVFESGIRLRTTGASGSLPVTLALRTNCPYRIAAQWQNASGSRLVLPPAEVAPSASSGGLSARALEASPVALELPPNSTAVCLRGPRISRRGNDRTPDNAVLVRISPVVPPGSTSAVLALTLQLGN
jgi:hypothetical protein